MVRRLAAVAALSLALAACSEASGRHFARYYDPRGLFTTNLPAANEITVTPPQPAQDGPALLTGVISSPPLPSPPPQTGLGAFNIAPAEEPDQTIYEAFAVTTNDFGSLSEMALYFLTGDPAFDVQIEDPVRLDGHEALLIVADAQPEGEVTASVAVALTLGRGGTGYLVAAIFPPGDWEKERPDFLRVLRSFRTDVPPGLETFPVAGGAP